MKLKNETKTFSCNGARGVARPKEGRPRTKDQTPQSQPLLLFRRRRVVPL